VHTIAKEYGVEKAYKTIINRYNDGWSIQEADSFGGGCPCGLPDAIC
jgi:hypothetical protein